MISHSSRIKGIWTGVACIHLSIDKQRHHLYSKLNFCTDKKADHFDDADDDNDDDDDDDEECRMMLTEAEIRPL